MRSNVARVINESRRALDQASVYDRLLVQTPFAWSMKMRARKHVVQVTPALPDR